MSWTMTDWLGLSLGSGICVGVGECKVVIGRRCRRSESPEVSESEMPELEWSMELGMSVSVSALELVPELGVP